MKFIGLVLGFFMLALVTTAQNVVYDENAEVRLVAPFSAIDASGTISVYLAQGTTQGVAVSAGDSKFNSKIKAEVKNGVLHLSVDGGMWNGFNWSNRKLKAYITVIDLNKIVVSGASFVTTTGPVKSNALRVDISGASEIRGEFLVNKLNFEMSGASVAKLSGTAQEAVIDASGACKFSGYELKVTRCKASSSGASVIRVTAIEELNADASGGSAISYRGTPTTKNLNASAASSIKFKGNDD